MHEKSERAGEAGEAAGPGGEFGAVGERQPEQFANHRQRQFAREALDEIGRTSFGKQLVGERVADRLDMRLHVEHGAAAESFVDDVAQPFVIGLVHREHAVGERAYDARHPPLQPRDVAVLPADGEDIGILQDPIGKRLRGRGPDLADDRKPHFHDWTHAAQILDRGGGVAKEVLAGEVCLQRHVLFRR